MMPSDGRAHWVSTGEGLKQNPPWPTGHENYIEACTISSCTTKNQVKTFLLQKQWLYLCSSLSLSISQDHERIVSLPVYSTIWFWKHWYRELSKK